MPERTDVSTKGIAYAGAGLAVTCVIIGAIVWMVFPRSTRIAPGFAGGAEPRVQAKPSDDLARMRARDEAALHSYGWVDRRAGVIHIPIERAMEVMTP